MLEIIPGNKYNNYSYIAFGKRGLPIDAGIVGGKLISGMRKHAEFKPVTNCHFSDTPKKRRKTRSTQ